MERKFLEHSLLRSESSTGAKVPCNESSWTFRSPGAKVLSMVFSLLGTKVQRNEKASYRILLVYKTRTKITTPLKFIFEASLKLKELPHDWVNANISAVYKKGKKSELCNYRPISLTSILCKIMEQFIREYYIIQHFLHNDLFSKNQFGILKGRSTMLQLLHYYGGMDNRTRKRGTD